MASDPYYLALEEVQSQVEQLKADFTKWERYPAGSAMRASMAQTMVYACDSVLSQVAQLDEATTAAEQNFARFKIDKAEIASRRSWNQATRAQIDSLKSQCQAALQEQAAKTKAGNRSTGSKLADAIVDSNDTYINSAAEQHAMTIRQQDQELDELSHAVKRVGVLAGTIGEELDQQNNLLTDLEDQIDGTGNRLAAAQRKLKHVIEKSSMTTQMIIIAVLVVILVLLIVLAIY